MESTQQIKDAESEVIEESNQFEDDTEYQDTAFFDTSSLDLDFDLGF